MPKHTLAIHGGTAVFPEGPPAWPVTTPEIRTSILSALDSDQWGLYDGEFTERLCRRLCETFSVQHALLCSSGTIAVELALRGVGVRSGDEVILSGYDFPGNFRAIEAIGAVPVLVDVCPNGWTIDIDCALAAVSTKTTAIVASHLHGETVDIQTLRSRLPSAQIKIVEDNCQAPGGTINGQPLGSLGDATSLSFGGSKLLSAGRGGAVLSHDESVVQRCKIFAHRGNDAFPLSQLQAAALLPQLDQLPELTCRRRDNAQWLGELTDRFPGIRRQQPHETVVPAFYKLPWMMDASLAKHRDTFVAAIRAEGILIDVGFRGFFKRSRRRCRTADTLDHARRAAEQTVILHHPALLESRDYLQRLGNGMAKVINFISQS